MQHRHLFPGNNTSEGFFSYYAHILPQSEASRIFCLKGGPGVGKSTFMERVANRMAGEGYMIEYLHCSSDPESLDGIVIPALRVALIDGTAPHVVDPVNPGAVDEIINLGEYWNRADIARHRDDVIAIGKQVGQLFHRAYYYLGAAKCLMNDALALYASPDGYGAYVEAEKIVNTYMDGHPVGVKPGRIRKMFASAITPMGVLQYIDTLINEDFTVCAVENRWGAGVTELLSRVSDAAIMRGLDVEQFYCPIDPAKRIDHLIVPTLKLAIISRSRYINPPVNAQAVVDMAQYANNDATAEFAEREFDVLLREALFTLNRAKVTHDQIEKYYVPHMDFKAVDRKAEEVIRAIEDIQYSMA